MSGLLTVHELINLISDKTKVGLIIERVEFPPKLTIYVPLETHQILRYVLEVSMSAWVDWEVQDLGNGASYLSEVEHLRVNEGAVHGYP
jgi:hypothetical protein